MQLKKRFRPYWVRILLLLSVIGPGIITANVDNDAGGISTYSVAGAHYGYGLLWMMPLVAIALIIVQEMSARLGVFTGKGLADLIRETMGVRITAIILSLLVFVNLANTVSEFAGVAASLEIFGISKFISIPIVAVLVWVLITRGNYETIEKIFLAASAIFLAYIVSGVLARPDWGDVSKSLISPQFHWESGYIIIFVTIIGTTIAPWMQFYQQSSIVDKGISPSYYHYERIDVVVGSIFAVLVACFIMIACAATLYKNNILINSAEDAAIALQPLAGRYASILFAIGLLNASVFAAAILPLSTAYTVSEAFGWESSLSRNFREAPIFFTIFTSLIILGALIVLLPIQSLIKAMIFSQTLNGVLLPVILVVMLLLINNPRIMGKNKNGTVANIISWTTVAILIILAAILVITTIFPGLFT